MPAGGRHRCLCYRAFDDHHLEWLERSGEASMAGPSTPPSPESTDLSLIPRGASLQLVPRSLLGMLWLQTYFDPSTWDLICSGEVRISADSSLVLQRDATAAGLAVERLQAPAAA